MLFWPANKAITPHMQPKKISIAVVDDDESFRRSLERLLRALGYETSLYSSAEAFLAPAQHPTPDCLVLDIHLGGMSGLDLQRRLRELGSTAPVVFVTANDTPIGRAEAERVGCSAYLLKPVTGQALQSAITQAVKKCAPAN